MLSTALSGSFQRSPMLVNAKLASLMIFVFSSFTKKKGRPMMQRARRRTVGTPSSRLGASMKYVDVQDLSPNRDANRSVAVQNHCIVELESCQPAFDGAKNALDIPWRANHSPLSGTARPRSINDVIESHDNAIVYFGRLNTKILRGI